MADEERNEAKTHEQHPIPQNVLGVEFKLIGGLTIHQFGFLAVFVFIAWIIYSSGLPGFIKTPIAAGVALLGVVLGLVPIQDRSADIWLKNFLLAVSLPTERVWRKSPANLDIFFELAQARSAIREQKDRGVSRDRSQLSEYLRNTPTDVNSPLDLAESEFLKSVRLLQNDVQLPRGLVTVVETPTIALPENPQIISRGEVRVSPSLASEVNYSQEKIISLPNPNRPTKFVTPIQNTRTGRRLKLVKPGEVGLGVLGEKKVASPPPSLQSQTEKLVKQTQDVAQRIDEAQSKPREINQINSGLRADSRVVPIPIIAPPPTKETAVIDLNTLRARATQTPNPEKSPVPTTLITPIFPPTPEQTATILKPEPAPPAVEIGKIAYLAEELEKMKVEKEKLLDDLEKQKKARSEAETYVALANEYQKRANEYAQQNSQLAAQIQKAQEQLKKLNEAGAQDINEKENLAKQIKEGARRLEQLAREKSQATDSLINSQKELRELRLKQRFAGVPAPKTNQNQTPAVTPGSTPADQTLARPKLYPFVKDANIVNGYVRNKNGNLVKDAVIIVKDAEGSPVRALKTTELGQFAITTALPNGTYSVGVSIEGEAFDIITVEVFGSILDPLDFVGH